MTEKRANRMSRTSILWAGLLVLSILAVGAGYFSLIQPFVSPPSAPVPGPVQIQIAEPTAEASSAPVMDPTSAPSAGSPTRTVATTEVGLVDGTGTRETEDGVQGHAVPATATDVIVTSGQTPSRDSSTPVLTASATASVVSPALTPMPAGTGMAADPTIGSAVTPTVSVAVPAVGPATAGAEPTPTSTLPPKALPPLNPEGRVGLGAYLPDIPYDEFASVEPFERRIEHRLAYLSWYHAWGDADRDWPADLVQLAIDRGAIPILTWEPWERDFENAGRIQAAYTLDTIVNGDHDPYIRTWARGARSAGAPIMIRFAHEQSTPPGETRWYPWQGRPEKYKAAFRHIVTIFDEEGATNVQFLWSAMWLDQWAHLYYPGDEYVDLVGTTVLNHGVVPSLTWGTWRTFDELFEKQHEAALQWNKPLMLTEWATAEQGGDKSAWLRDGLASLETEYPLVEGVVLFELPEDRQWPAINWSVPSSSKALAGFREAIRDPYFR